MIERMAQVGIVCFLPSFWAAVPAAISLAAEPSAAPRLIIRFVTPCTVVGLYQNQVFGNASVHPMLHPLRFTRDNRRSPSDLSKP